MYTKMVKERFFSQGVVRPVWEEFIANVLSEAKKAEREGGMDKAYEVFEKNKNWIYESTVLYNIAKEVYDILRGEQWTKKNYCH